MVNDPKRIVRIIEKENISETQHQARNRHWDHAEKLYDPAAYFESLALLHQVGALKYYGGPDHSGPCSQFERVEIGIPTATVHKVKIVVI